MKKIYIFCLTTLIISTNIYAEDLTDIQITAPVLNSQDLTKQAIEDINTKNAIDGGDLLRSINGINTIRRGGHGLDPVIRGQSDQRLNSFLNGAIVYGACSSKMDPASTYVNIENYDSISVIKGSQSVLYGPGGPGGVIRYETITEPLYQSTKDGSKQGQTYKLKIGQTFDSNAEAKTTIGDFTLGLGQAYFRVNGSYSEAGNYETGTGLKPLTEYQTSNYSTILGKRLDDGSKLEFTYTDNSQENIGFAGLPMDIVYSYTDIYNLKYHRVTPLGLFTSMKIEMFNSDMDHLMDNYTMRSANSMRTPAASDTYGGRIIGATNSGMKIGVDYEHNTRDAEQNMVISGTERHLAYLWPGAEIAKLGLFLEKDNKVSEQTTMSYGLRLDRVETDATRAADDPGSAHMAQVTANSLYTAHYSGTVTVGKRDFSNFSGFLRFKKDYGPMSSAYISLSRNERTPDATELFNAKTSMAMGGKYRLRHIGNPNLNSEVHTTLEIGFENMFMGSHVNGSLYLNDISDYITTYRASDGTYDNTVNDARIYKNVDATIWGYELTAQKDITSNVKTIFNLNYTHGDDDTQNRPLAQMMPLSGDISLEYQTGSVNYGIRANFADTQDRFDSRVLDTGRTGGYTVYDLYAGFEPTPNIRFTMGISNLTDKRYATHLNSTNSLNATADRVDEPGRSFWGSLIYDF
ncbi:MAG: TonB-dependent receptor [Gammaproteobacteria bacterium]|nr:TonB-dependent receptor [Gammaproteobacteria bacterium]